MVDDAAIGGHDHRYTAWAVSTSVKSRIMDVARTEVRRSRLLPLQQPRPGELASPLTISELSVAEVVRRTVLDQIHQHHLPAGTVSVTVLKIEGDETAGH